MQTAQETVRLVNLSKKFGSIVAVDNLDISIEPGEFVTLLGPSGCGKSTTLRMLGGFETPTSGQIFLGEDDVTNIPPNRRNVNMVFQDYALFPHMTVGQNISFGLELKGLGKNEIEERVISLLDFMQLDGYKARRPDELSGGQRQRVALARALAPDPKVLLLDEPLGALDAKLRKQVQIELKSIQKRTGKTFIFVTHDQEEALTMSDRILVMNEGHLEQDGAPKDLYFHPESRFVADFVGETNMLSCTVKGTEGTTVVLDWQGHELRGQCRSGDPKDGQKVDAVIRPEKVTCHASDPGDGTAIEGRVTQSIFKGSYTTVGVMIGENESTTIQASGDNTNFDNLKDNQVWISLDPAFLTVLTR
jgi:spermidine/putrescine transport system ATP-binding protein